MKQRILLCALLVGCGSGSSGKGGIDGGAGGSAGTGDSGGGLGEDGGAGVGAAGATAGSGGKAGTTGADGGRDAATDRTIHADGAVATGGWGSPCWSQTDCDQSQGTGSFLVCVEPGRSLGGGTGGGCFMSQSLCANDAQCAAKTPNSICMPVQCSPPPDDGCRPGCMTAGCVPGFACGANNRCTPQPCTPDVVCPVNETCSSGFGCVPKSCTRDDQCSGACVGGSCYDRPGTCMPLPV